MTHRYYRALVILLPRARGQSLAHYRNVYIRSVQETVKSRGFLWAVREPSRPCAENDKFLLGGKTVLGDGEKLIGKIALRVRRVIVLVFYARVGRALLSVISL